MMFTSTHAVSTLVWSALRKITAHLGLPALPKKNARRVARQDAEASFNVVDAQTRKKQPRKRAVLASQERFKFAGRGCRG